MRLKTLLIALMMCLSMGLMAQEEPEPEPEPEPPKNPRSWCTVDDGWQVCWWRSFNGRLIIISQRQVEKQ